MSLLHTSNHLLVAVQCCFMLQRYSNIRKAVINDVNENLVLTYRSIKDNVELLMSFEEEFGIRIPDAVAMQMKTVKDIVDLIDSKN